MEAIVDADLVFRVKDGFNMSPRECSVNDVSEDDRSISTSSCDYCSIMAPGKTEN